MRPYAIHYTYNGRKHCVVTKPCTRTQAVDAFHNELNSLDTFELVRIVAQ
jgi:hypothetical protein